MQCSHHNRFQQSSPFISQYNHGIENNVTNATSVTVAGPIMRLMMKLMLITIA